MWNLATTFRPVVQRLGLEPETTPYALRHSSIVRQLLKGVPTRVVAAHHDTSVAMIEKNYSRFIIGDPSDALTRATLLDLEKSPSFKSGLSFTGLVSARRRQQTDRR